MGASLDSREWVVGFYRLDELKSIVFYYRVEYRRRLPREDVDTTRRPTEYFEAPTRSPRQTQGAVVSQDSLFDVKAQISGVFYRASGPDVPPFVEPGATVRKGQTLALLESMKLFSKVKSPADGVVVEVAAENESPVSVGQVLVRLRRN